jgi:hypothetical protein
MIQTSCFRVLHGEYLKRRSSSRRVAHRTMPWKILPAHASASNLTRSTVVDCPRSPCVTVGSGLSKLLSSVTTQRLVSNCLMPLRHWAYDGFLPVDLHLKSARELDAGSLSTGSCSPMYPPNCLKLAAEQTKPRPRSPGDTLHLQPASSSTKTLTSATNRSLAERF